MSAPTNGYAAPSSTTNGHDASHDDKPDWFARHSFPALPESTSHSKKFLGNDASHPSLHHDEATSAPTAAAIPGQSQDPNSDHHHEVPATIYLTPPQILDHVADAGGAKTKSPFFSELILGIMAGAYIGFGFSLCMLGAGQLSEELRMTEPGLFNILFGVFGFPFGLTLCVVAGASLFTSNVLYMTTALWQGKAKWYHVIYELVFSWFANLCGSLLLAGLMVWGQIFHDREEFTLHLAHKKTGYPFQVAFVKGILCNWLVCLATWQANGANDITGKAVAVWLPISAFVAMGFEHCIANQFMIPLSMMLGADITFYQMIVCNWIPVTLGNLVGGGLFVATFYCMAYGRPGTAVNKQVDKGWHWSKEKVASGMGRREPFNASTSKGRSSSKDVLSSVP